MGRATIAVLVCVLLAVGCGPSARQRACRLDCQRRHDGCMLGAGNATEIQRCDDGMSVCVRACR